MISAAIIGLMGAPVAVFSETVEATTPPPNGVRLVGMQGTRTAFFSTPSGEPFCRFRFGNLQAAGSRVGPFRVARPGIELIEPALEFFATPVSPADWDALPAHLAPLQRAPLPQPLSLTLPDGRRFSVARMPAVRGRQLRFLRARPHRAPDAPGETLVLTARDPEGVVIEPSHPRPSAETAARAAATPAPVPAPALISALQPASDAPTTVP